MGIDIAAVMDALRIMAIDRQVALPDAHGKQFNRSFLGSVRRHGRVFEMGMMAFYKLRTGDLLSDVGKVPQMLAKGKLSLLPKRSGSAKEVREVFRRAEEEEQKAVKYAFFPGCSLESTAWDFDWSTRAVCRALGIELTEIPDWVCCGSTPAHASSASLAVALPVLNLQKAQALGLPVMTACASCYARLRTANHKVRNEAEDRQRAERITGKPYDGEVEVHHVLDVLVNHFGLEQVRAKVVRPLEGLRVACYYGCLLTRPPEIVAFDNPEHPTCMDDLVAAAGAEPVDWPYKTECCGASLSMTRSDVVSRLGHKLLSMARQAGAECIAVACPVVPGEPRPASGRRGQGPRRASPDAGALCHAASRAGLGAFVQRVGHRRLDASARVRCWPIARRSGRCR